MSGAHRDEQGFILATAILAWVVLGASCAVDRAELAKKEALPIRAWLEGF